MRVAPVVLKTGGVAIKLLAVLSLLAMAAAPNVHAGVLSLGQPTIENGQYTFPVELLGADGQVSALDFRIQFDPEVFQPVSAVAGNAALAANKMVSANYAAPGEYVVVMMGLNQTALAAGQVASVVMQRAGDTGDAISTQIAITGPTLAGPDGAELSASGSSLTLPLRDAKPGEEPGGDETTPDEEGPAPVNGDPAKADDAEAPAPNTSRPAQRARPMLAGSPADNVGPPVAAPQGAPAGVAPAAPLGGTVTAANGLPIVEGAAPLGPGPETAGMLAQNSRMAHQKMHNTPAPDSGAMAQSATFAKVESSAAKENGSGAMASDNATGDVTAEGDQQSTLYLLAAVVLFAGSVLLAVMYRKKSSAR